MHHLCARPANNRSWAFAPWVVLVLLSATLAFGAEVVAPATPAPDATAGESAATQPAGQWLDHLQEKVAGDIGGSARWVDGFFGEDHYPRESRGAYGTLSLRTGWKNYEGIKARVRLRAYLPLDNARHLAHAFIGRGDSDQIVAGDNGYDGLMTTSKDNHWLAGLGYTPEFSAQGRLSFSAGVRVTWPPDPYLRATYSFEHKFSEASLVRVRETLFWQQTESFGTSTALDLEHRVNEDNMLRWANWGKVSKLTAGAQYDSRLMFYRNLRKDRAIMHAVGVRGDSGEPVPVREFGLYGIYRQRAFRPWLYGELILGVTRLRELGWNNRRTSLLVGCGFEMTFGEQTPATAAGWATDRLFGDRL